MFGLINCGTAAPLNLHRFAFTAEHRDVLQAERLEHIYLRFQWRPVIKSNHSLTDHRKNTTIGGLEVKILSF